MEIVYPIVIILAIVLVIVINFIKDKKDTYSGGGRIANTKYIKANEYYKKLLKKYNVLAILMKVCISLALIIGAFLGARLVETEVVTDTLYNRDIFICMDVSSSVDDLNIEMIDYLKSTVGELEGERFGISIFNTTSVLVVPLTTDYNYVSQVLEQMSASFDANTEWNYDSLYDLSYISSGTLVDSGNRGGSNIGDGLATCASSFTDDEDRTKVVLFTTDNELAGKPIFTLDEAAALSKDKGVIVYSIGTKNITAENRTSLKNASELTGGRYFDTNSSTVSSIVSKINELDKSKVESNTVVKKNDQPEILFISLLVIIFILFFLDRRVKL